MRVPGAGAAMGGAVMGRCLVTGGLAPGLALSESESADSVTAVAQGLRRSASLAFGTSVRYGLETEAEADNRNSRNWKPKPNRKTELPTIRFGFGSVRFGFRFSVKKRPG